MIRSYTVEYACACTVGKVRKNNEDNFYCDGQIRLDPYSVEDVVLSGKVRSTDNELFAVFDGMGGEACGEIASFAAAQNCMDFLEDKDEYQEYLYELSNVLNEKILEETKARSLVLMGTTAAMIQFYKEEIYILNAGDSKIFKLTKNKLNQISQDHVALGYSGKAPLTKFLGIPDTNGLSPYIARGAYKVNDMFILCTDGVTDMIDEETLCDMLREKKPLKDIAENIINRANENGGCDNATLILCKIHK